MIKSPNNQPNQRIFSKDHDQPSGGQTTLWQEYCQNISSIAGVYSDSYWVSQSHEMLKNQPQPGVQSKTKRVLDIMNGTSSKVDLINKIMKNLAQCRKIQQNQQQMVQKLIKLNLQWDKWKQIHLANICLQQGLSYPEKFQHSQGQQYPEHLETFESNFDNKRLEQFEKSQDYEQKDIQI